VPLCLLFLLIFADLARGETSQEESSASSASDFRWAEKAVWYQIFPERFRNGDPKNDPTAEYGRVPDHVRAKWRITPWTKEWYAMDDWEQDLAPDVYGSVHHRRYGGDFQGVIDKLDYLKDLGITALYFNPVFAAPTLHKYDALVFHHMDPFFGPDPAADLELLKNASADPSTWTWSAADKLFLELVKQAHARGMKIVIDGVFNHTATDFFAFADIRERQKESKYRDWYTILSWADPGSPDRRKFDWAGWDGHKSLPEFSEVTDEQGRKTLHPEVKAYIFAITRRWMDPNGDGDPSDGIDGWRLDVAEKVGDGFWQEWNDLVKSINPHAYTTAEIWGEASGYLERTRFDAAMNYHAFAIPIKGGLIDGTLPVREFVRTMEDRRSNYTEERFARMMNLFDSHDTDRFASMIVNRDRTYYGNPDMFAYDAQVWAGSTDKPYFVRKPDASDRKLQRMIVLFQAAYPGAPYLYYGTEAGMWGADDPDDRMPMVWEDLKFEPQTLSPGGQPKRNDDVNFDAPLHAYHREALALRRQHPALQDGSFQLIGAENSSKMFAFARTGTEMVLAVFNRHSDPQTFTFQFGTTDGSEPPPLEPFFISSGATSDAGVKQTKGKASITLPGFTGALFRQK
jgi:cyclomaltodextrinase